MLVSRTYRNNLGYQIDVDRPNPILAWKLNRFNKNHYTFDGYNTYMVYTRGGEKGMQYGGSYPSKTEHKGKGMTMKDSLKIAEMLNTRVKSFKDSVETTTREKLKNPYGKFMNPTNTYRPGFAGEKHLTNDKGIEYNFCGPGTNIEARLRRGDPPIDAKGLDVASRIHDIDYHNARTFNDIKKADVKFIDNVQKSNINKASKKIIKKLFKTKSQKREAKIIPAGIENEIIPLQIEINQPSINITGQGNIFRNNTDPAKKLRSKMKKYKTKKKKDKLLSIAINSIKNRIKK